MTNLQRAVAIRAHYKGAIYMIANSIATYSALLLRETAVLEEGIDVLKSAFSRIPAMYDEFSSRLENEEVASAMNQINFMIGALESVLADIASYKDTIESHSSDASIAAKDFAALQKLEGLAEAQLSEMENGRSTLEAENE